MTFRPEPFLVIMPKSVRIAKISDLIRLAYTDLTKSLTMEEGFKQTHSSVSAILGEAMGSSYGFKPKSSCLE
jgi:hypothetical protein